MYILFGKEGCKRGENMIFLGYTVWDKTARNTEIRIKGQDNKTWHLE